MLRFFLLVATLLFTPIVNGQYQIGLVPRTSPDRTVSQKIGYTEVIVTYGSPAVNERIIWGELVAYDTVWRAGANNATTIEFSDDVNIGGQLLKAGKYGFFVIPKAAGEWTVIFNKVHKQWGAFSYDDAEDALRINVTATKSTAFAEQLTFGIEQSGFQAGSIVLAWEQLQLTIPIETHYLDAFIEEVESRVAKQPAHLKWVVYVQGAEHLEQINSATLKANDWLDKAEGIMNSTEEWNEQFYPRDYIKAHLYWTRAKLYAGQNKLKLALNYVGQLEALGDQSFYKKKNAREGIDGLVKTWRTKL